MATCNESSHAFSGLLLHFTVALGESSVMIHQKSADGDAEVRVTKTTKCIRMSRLIG